MTDPIVFIYVLKYPNRASKSRWTFSIGRSPSISMKS